MNSIDANTWILGLDLGERSRGALCVSDWLAGPEHTLAMHVLELWSRAYIRTDALVAARAAVRRIADDLRLAEPTRVAVTDSETADGGLMRAVEGAAGLIVCRAADRHQGMPWALGHVTWRLLRRLPCPVVVAPRELTTIASGPILLATDLEASSEGAVGFARTLAARRGREFVVVHIGETRESELVGVDDPSWQRARESHRAELERAVHRWMVERALLGQYRVVHGSVVDELEALAVATQAVMIVVGSRRLGGVGRLFLGSTSSALAARSPCPVAVVPPP